MSADFAERTVIIVHDMHNLIYRVYHALALANERRGEGQDPAPEDVVATVTHALRKAREALSSSDAPVRHHARLAEASGGVCEVFAWDGGGPSFRHRSYPEYKAKRKPRPAALDAALAAAARALSGPQHLRVLGWEADDVIATFVKGVRDSTWEQVPIAIVSNDADLLQLVAHPKVCVYIPAGARKGFIGPTAFERDHGFAALWWPDYRALKGDDADNIPGIPGIGHERAKGLVQRYGPLEAIFGVEPPKHEDAPIVKRLTPENFALAQRWRELTRLHEQVPGVGVLAPLGYDTAEAS